MADLGSSLKIAVRFHNRTELSDHRIRAPASRAGAAHVIDPLAARLGAQPVSAALILLGQIRRNRSSHFHRLPLELCARREIRHAAQRRHGKQPPVQLEQQLDYLEFHVFHMHM